MSELTSAMSTARVLVEALPYIRRFAGKVVVVKHGGHAIGDATATTEVAHEAARDEPPALLEGNGLRSFAEDVVMLHSVGVRPVVVHGGGPQIGALMARLGKEAVFKGGLRVTDRETLEIARMVLVGKVNREIVSAINVHGPIAVGLSGEDANVIVAAPRDRALGFVGDVEIVDAGFLGKLIAEGLVPVIATIGAHPSGQAYNINADLVAGAIAAALEAEKLVFLTDVEGVRRDPQDPSSLIRSAGASEIRELIERGAATGGMGPKLEAALRALDAGVRRVHVVDGRMPHALLLELLTDEGVGTMLEPDPDHAEGPAVAATLGGAVPTAAAGSASRSAAAPTQGASASVEESPGQPARHEDAGRGGPKEPPTELASAAAVPEGRVGVLMPVYHPPRVVFVRGEGAWLFDAEGKRYLDFFGGIAVAVLGHAHPRVAEAICEQARTLLHVSNVFGNPHGPRLATAIDELVGGGRPGGGMVFLANSGTEANECAIKLARRFQPAWRRTIVSAIGSFHGRTLGALAATGQDELKEPFAPLASGFAHVPYDDLEAMEAALGAGDVAAVMLEPILGEGGVVAPSDGYLAGVRRLCDRYGALLVVDEVQTGLGRTGNWFAFEHDGIRPDVVTLAKGLGNGMPIGACWARREVATAFRPGDHGSTFGGQPLAVRAALATLDALVELDAPARAARLGTRLADALRGLSGVVQVRGRGLMIGVLLDGPRAPVVAAEALRLGLVVQAVRPEVLRLLPPLVIDDEQLDQGIAILEEALRCAR